jgi:beta-xylosidase
MEDDDSMKQARNPIIWADVPDPDVIRVGDYYYMVSTTMHLSPGVPIMRSRDLVDWELISYVYDRLEENDSYHLTKGKHVYGKGSWAASIRYHEGSFYVCFASLDMKRTYIYRTEDIVQGPWVRSVLEGVYHDPSLFFEEDGRVYLIHGNGVIRITELTSDAGSVKKGGTDKILLDAVRSTNLLNSEGSHFYKIRGRYYLFLIEWPKIGTRRRIQWCYRSDSLLGDYEGRVVLNDDFHYGNHGVAQGGIIETPEGAWYGMLFQDHDAVGRIPILLPVTWQEGWPMMGIEGRVPLNLSIMTVENPSASIVANDEFEYQENVLQLPWQWNHNPDPALWSLMARPGYLRLTTGSIAPNLMAARNTLTQRTLGPVFSCDTLLDAGGMKQGDYAGLAAFQNGYGMLGVRVREDGSKQLILAANDGSGDPAIQAELPLQNDRVALRIDFVFNSGSMSDLRLEDKAYFYYSYDGRQWSEFAFKLPMKYTLDHFMGYRAALFCYATSQIGGYADFDYYHCERRIPWNDSSGL